MPTLVLRNVPDDLYGRLRQAAADHHRSLAQEAIVALQFALLGAANPPRRLSVEESLDWLKAEVWTLPVLDRRTDDQILGYNADGYCDFAD
jgi:antitoxin VapB